jgi:hypothetical protein
VLRTYFIAFVFRVDQGVKNPSFVRILPVAEDFYAEYPESHAGNGATSPSVRKKTGWSSSGKRLLRAVAPPIETNRGKPYGNSPPDLLICSLVFGDWQCRQRQ